MASFEELKDEIDALKQQLRLADAVNAALVAEKEVLHAQPAAKDSELHSCRQAVALSPLDRDEIFDTIFGYVGEGDYLYTGAVSRWWKGRYVKLCRNLIAQLNLGINAVHELQQYTRISSQAAVCYGEWP
jgi:hypothetical protein